MPYDYRTITDLQEKVDKSMRAAERFSLLTGAPNHYSAASRMHALVNSSAIDRFLVEHDRFTQIKALVEPAWMRSLRQMEENQARLNYLLEPSKLDRALKAAETAQMFALPTALERFRAETDLLARRMALVQGAAWWRDASHIGAFTAASALSNAFAESRFVDAELRNAGLNFLAATPPNLPSLAAHRMFLDAAGLGLPRWPRLRRLTASDKKQRFHARLRANSEPTHVRKAKSLTYQYEMVLRDAIDSVMTEAYGDEWWIERLPACGCKDLLGRWQSQGGHVLDHADFPHYIRIMCHPEHHQAGFDIGFPEVVILEQLISAARQLRAASHHPGRERFTPQDLQALRVIWNEIKVGLIEMLPDHEFE